MRTLKTIAFALGIAALLFVVTRIVTAADGPCSPPREPAPPKGGQL